MNALSKLLNAKRNIRWLIWFIAVGLFSFCLSCEKLNTEQDTTKVYIKLDEDQKSITQHLEENPDSFSILCNILDTTGLIHLFKTYGSYTFLAPTNTAFENFFKEQGKSSYEDYDTNELKNLIKYHVFKQYMKAGSFSDGIIENLTLSKDRMTSGVSLDGSDIMFNKESRILSQDWLAANGIIQTVDRVIEKPVLNMYDWLSNQGNFTIFIDALNKTGLDTIAQKMVDKYGKNSFYTCFATPDEVYKESNINSFDDLAKLVSPDYTSYTDTNLVSFVASQFLTDVLSTSDATDEQVYYGTVGGATIRFGLIPNSANLVLNYNTVDFPHGLAVNGFKSNNLTKNGIVHVMDTVYLVNKSFLRIRRSFVYLDVPGFPYDSLFNYNSDLYELYTIVPKCGANSDADDELIGCAAQQWPGVGISHIPFESTNGWITLNAPYSGLIKADSHRFIDLGSNPYVSENKIGPYNPIFFTWEPCDDLLDVTRKIPYIIPGKYILILETKAGSNRPTIKNYFDGKEIGGIINLQTAGLTFMDLELGIVEIKKDEDYHYLRTQTLTTGKGFFVAIKFQPVD